MDDELEGEGEGDGRTMVAVKPCQNDNRHLPFPVSRHRILRPASHSHSLTLVLPFVRGMHTLSTISQTDINF